MSSCGVDSGRFWKVHDESAKSGFHGVVGVSGGDGRESIDDSRTGVLLLTLQGQLLDHVLDLT